MRIGSGDVRGLLSAVAAAVFPVFPAYERARLYQFLHGFLEAPMNLREALLAVSEIFALGDEARRARACEEMADALMGGRFEVAAARYLPVDEVALIEACGELGYGAAMTRLESLCAMGERLKRASRGAVGAPLALLAVAAGMLAASASLIDLFADIPGARLPALARAYRWAGHGIADSGSMLILAGVGLYALILWALPNYCGWGRTWLDRFPPFSGYRLRMCAPFVLWLCLLMGKNRHLDRDWGEKLTARASPYLRDRVERIVKRIGRLTPGEAMAAAGTGFPDGEIAALTMLAERRAHSDSGARAALMDRAAARWMERIEDRLRRTMAGFRLTAMAVIAGFLGSFYLLFYQMWASGGLSPGALF